jgi:8-amino-7-oxononanoate synthase
MHYSSSDPYLWIEQSLQTIHRANWYRSVQPLQGRPGAVVTVDGKSLINFASNDYLGLAGDDRLIQAANAATQAHGTGSTGSRLITGHRDLHHQLETAIADLKQTEDALVFSSGYLANLGTIAALVGSRDLILADEYNHASLKHGAVLSKATVVEYAHCDLQDLESKLSQQRSHHRRCLIVTDSIFSMDGDRCPLTALLQLADEHQCMVLVDEAHATGVFGATGAGLVEHSGFTKHPLIQIGTLSKALGSLGGYVAGSRSLIDFLRNRAASWIYTTGLSPADTAAALTAIALVQQEPQLRIRLWQNVHYLRDRLDRVLDSSLPYQRLESDSPIICLQMTDAASVIAAGQWLKSQRLLVAAVRPPTVPTSRLRITVMATHERSHLDHLVNALTSLSLS